MLYLYGTMTILCLVFVAATALVGLYDRAAFFAAMAIWFRLEMDRHAT